MLNPYEQYKKTSVNTMTKGELLLLLYDEVIKKLNISKILLENKDYKEAEIHLSKCRNIINHLIVSLDEKYEISRELKEMYFFFNREILKASISKNDKNIDDILPLIKDLRNTWAEADKISRTSKLEVL
ncbi:MAG: flagellar export chaperone FliS [Tissierellia bacterium]|nr:flagellar export chaperone FliS [Tissierellia bacterium]MDD4781370.1 flagellar export chaperone FliS [Tissierellia bacterium]